MTIIAAADGSALGNPGPAGWAWYIDRNRWASGGWAHGTNNMGELTAVLDLLEQTAGLDDDLVIVCDSTYVINTVSKWMAGWKRRGWRKGDGKPVSNLDIIQRIDAAMEGRKVRFEWVKGHTGHPLNEAADGLANAAALAMKEGRDPDAGPGIAGSPASAPIASRSQPPAAEPDADLFSLEEISDEDRVIELEKSLLTDDVRGDLATVRSLLHDDWVEIAKSGIIYTKSAKLDQITPGLNMEFELVEVARLAPDVILLRWRGHSEHGNSERATIWVRQGERWVQRYHQGTPERA